MIHLLGHPVGKGLAASGMVYAAGIHLNDAIIVAVAVIVGLFVLVRGRSDIWKSNYDAEQIKADRLAEENAKLRERIASLEAQPSLAKLYDLFEQHDRLERETWQRIEAIINQIAGRLAPASP